MKNKRNTNKHLGEGVSPQLHTGSGSRDIALVLSSGGARGLAHIGAIEELEQQGFRISSVAGCSMGALVGGMFAAGRLQDFKQWMFDLDRSKIWKLTDLSLSLTHLMKGERVIEAMKDVVPDVNIEELPLPYCAVATDWESGREVVYRRGSLYDAIRASISMPAVFSPVRREGMILVDGGIINPLPLNQVERQEDDLLVAVNVSGPDFEGQSRQRHEREEEEARKMEEAIARRRSSSNPLRRHLPNIPTRAELIDRLLPDELSPNYITLVDRSLSIAIKQNAALALQLYQPDILADIPLTDFDGFDYDKGEEIAAIGRNVMRKAIAKWKKNLP
ncbi:MAG: patatin-like phospholipase family protein [Bacteroidaceae bacterium]|nr:patatin-like phospholipase family protein [Bacteroidaceae bacterium]